MLLLLLLLFETSSMLGIVNSNTSIAAKPEVSLKLESSFILDLALADSATTRQHSCNCFSLNHLLCYAMLAAKCTKEHFSMPYCTSHPDT